MNPVLVLKSNASDGYWYEAREVQYPKLMSYDILDELSRNLPAPGVGIYLDRHKGGRLETLSLLAPALLKVTGIRKDTLGRPHIKVECLARLTGVTSADMDRLLGSGRWVGAVSRAAWDRTQQALELRPPREWSHMLEISQAAPVVRDYLGPRYLELLKPDVDYATVRRIVSDSLRGMGFDVTELSFVEQHETNPDAFVSTPAGERFGHWFVCNCKSAPFHLSQEAVFRTRSYVLKCQREFPAQKAVPAAAARFLFVAPSFENTPDSERNMAEVEKQSHAKGCLMTFEALLLALTKKLQLGYRFTFGDFDRLFDYSNVVDAGTIEAVFRS